MARVAGDGPFSVFEGIDRTLALLDGEGLDLSIEGLGDRRLTAGDEPLGFPADAPTQARLIGGPVTDLNAMTRRRRCRHRVARQRIESSLPVELSSDWTLLVPLAECRLAGEGPQTSMQRGDVAVGERTAVPVTVLTGSPTLVYIVRVDRVE